MASRFLVRSALVCLLLLAVAGGGRAQGLFSADALRGWLADRLAAQLSSDQIKVELDGVSGRLTDGLTVDTIRLVDRDGPFLTISGAVLNIVGRDLLQRRLTIERLAAAELNFERTPNTAAAATSPPAQPFSLPELPVAVDLRRLEVQRLVLGRDVLGQRLIAHVAGQARLEGGAGGAELHIRRTDGKGGAIDLAVELTQDGILALDASVSEPTGTVLKDALATQDPVPLALSVAGTGPIAGWTGALTANAGDLVRIDAAVTIARGADTRIGLAGTAAIARAVAPPLAPLIADPVSFDAAVAIGDVVRIERLRVDAGAVSASGQGQLDPASNRVQAALRLAAADLAPLSDIVGAGLGGTMAVDIGISGALPAPDLQAALHGSGVQIASAGVRDVSARVTAAHRGMWILAGNGRLAGLSVQGVEPAALLPSDMAWSLSGSLADDYGSATVETLRVETDAARIEARGEVEGIRDAPVANGTVGLEAPDLARLAAALGADVSGRLRMNAEIRHAAGETTARIDGRAPVFRTGIAALDALTGGRLALKGELVSAPDGVLTANAIAVDAAHATLRASGRLSLAADRVEAKAQLGIASLSALSAPLGAPYAGDLRIDAAVSGPVARPSLTATVAGRQLVLAGRGLEQLRLDLASADMTSLAGRVEGRFRAAGLDGGIALRTRRESPGTLRVDELRVTYGGSEATGTLRLDLASQLASGRISARAPDLSQLSTLAGVALAGSAQARIDLIRTAAQDARIALTADELSIGDPQAPLTIRHAQVDGALADLRGRPTGHVEARASDAARAGARLDTVRVLVRALRPESYTVEAEADGVLHPDGEPVPLRIASAAAVAMSAQALRIEVQRLDGRLGEHRVALARPLTVSRSAAATAFQNLALRIDAGTIAGSGSLEGERIAADIRIDALPLDLVGTVLPRQRVAGRLSGTLRANGTIRSPDARAAMTVAGLKVAEGRNVPPLGVMLSATWRGQQVDAEGRIDGPGGADLSFSATAPLALQAEPFAIRVPEDAPLRARLRGEGALESWAQALPLGEDRLSGRFSVDLAVSGTPARPEAGGRLSVANGRYANFQTGTVLSDLALLIEGQGQRWIVRTLSARDDGDGRLSGSGSIDLAAAGGPSADLGIDMRGFRALRRDDVSLVAEGTARALGALDALAITGDIRIVRGEVNVAERLPPSVVQLDPIIINSETGAVISRPDAPSDGGGVTLAVRVTAPGRVFVRGRGLDSEWRGDLSITGTAAAPAIAGTLEVVRGQLSFLGKRFVLSRGTIRFDGGTSIDPQLDILAEHRAADIVAQVAITGTPSNPVLTLTSQPELPQDEILARVLFGRSVTEMTPGQGIELAAAAASLAGRGPGVLDRIRSATGLDRLEIGGGSADGGETTGPTVSGGKYISDRVYLGLEQGGRQGTTRTQVEIELTPNITLETNIGTNANTDVGINWKWDY